GYGDTGNHFPGIGGTVVGGQVCGPGWLGRPGSLVRRGISELPVLERFAACRPTKGANMARWPRKKGYKAWARIALVTSYYDRVGYRRTTVIDRSAKLDRCCSPRWNGAGYFSPSRILSHEPSEVAARAGCLRVRCVCERREGTHERFFLALVEAGGEPVGSMVSGHRAVSPGDCGREG